MEFADDTKNELLHIIELASTGAASLTNRETAMLYHWIRNINAPEYSWVPEKYKVNMPQYTGGQK